MQKTSTPEDRTLSLDVGLSIENARNSLRNTDYHLKARHGPSVVTEDGAAKVKASRALIQEVMSLCQTVDQELSKIQVQE